MKILICDDEKPYIDIIKSNINNYFSEKHIDNSIETFRNGDFILSSHNYYDIAFLDVEMGEISGIDIAKELKKINPHIILFFITAYEKYLDNAMDLNALRFLSKPLNIKRLFEGLDKALLNIDESTIEILLKNRNEVKKIISNDIIMVEINGKNTVVYTTNGNLESRNKIAFWQEKLNKSYFYHIHKSFIINANYITEYKRDEVVLNNQFKAPVSYRKQSAFRNYIMSMIERR